ncbi:MAG: Ca-activated chloride channel family protein [Desulforhopalus sp.]|jgi:Ca-activated chloride channel family protein
MKKYLSFALVIVVAGGWLVMTLKNVDWSLKALLVTPTQEYQYYFNKREYVKAANSSVDSLQQGSALYLAGEFKKAAAVFGSSGSLETVYNRANSYVMLGKYDLAIADYENVLKKKPEWKEASDNLVLARLRKEKMAPPEDDFGGTGGKLAADEIVIGDKKTGSSVEDDDENQMQEGSQLSQNEQQALWLKKVQTKPADFLRLKFSYQLANQK